MSAREQQLVPALLARAFDASGRGSDRLAPERALAVELGASRATVRQALAVLGHWGVTQGVRGSGVRVRPRAEWSLGALPALVGAARAEGEGAREAIRGPWLRHLVADALALRRAVVRQLPARVGREVGRGDLDPARRAADRAWARRHDPVAFVGEDAAVVRAILIAAGATATTWTWNELTAVAVALAAGVTALSPQDPYLATQETALGALERGDGRTASRTLATHLARLDRELLRGLPAPAGAR